MILTVTPNPALDVSYQTDRVVTGGSHRVIRLGARAGGKGVNVAAVAAAMGRPVLAMGLVGGAAGALFEDDLTRRGLPHRFLPGPGETRTSVNVYALQDDESTIFNEAGPGVGAADWALLVAAATDAALASAEVGVVSGSMPPGLPDEAVGELVAAARTRCGWVLDARGPALLAALEASPAVVKPNAAELRETVEIADPLAAARELQRRGARLVVVSDGARGVVAVPPTGAVVTARLPQALRGNPTGAGDALAAGIAAALIDDLPLTDLLRHAVAWSGASVLQRQAGSVDPADVARILPTVLVEEL